MNNILPILEKQLEEALHDFEQKDHYEQALEEYKKVEEGVFRILSSLVEEKSQAYRLLAQCFLRQAEMLRQLGRREEASVMNEKEIQYARLSGNSISYAQSLFSSGINLLSNRETDRGLVLLNTAKAAFEEGETEEHLQGIGWYWVILADLGNKKIIDATNEEIVHFGSQALEILIPIKNTPGIQRAYAARAVAYQNLGDFQKAEEDLSAARQS